MHIDAQARKRERALASAFDGHVHLVGIEREAGRNRLDALEHRALELADGEVSQRELHVGAIPSRRSTEADHVGIFLMTFAGYDPEQALAMMLSRNKAASKMLSGRKRVGSGR